MSNKKIHILKLETTFWDDVHEGRKTFEVRKNDRGFQRGDLVSFKCVEVGMEIYAKEEILLYEIDYVLSGWGIAEGYVVFSIKQWTENLE